MKKSLTLPVLLLLTACIAQPVAQSTPTAAVPRVLIQEDNSFAPRPQDSGLIRAGAILTSLDLSDQTGSSPLRTQLNILGSMPSACNELRVQVDPPTPGYEIKIEIYSIQKPGATCENVFQEFNASILLGKYSPGEYSVWVNTEFVGYFVSY